MGILSTAARQVRKIKKLSKPANDGQKQIEPAVREQRAYAKGQAKIAAAGGAVLLTREAVNKMNKRQMEERLLKEERKAEEATTAKERETAAKNRALLQVGIEKAVAEANNTGMKGNNTRGTSPKPKLRPKEMNKGGYANCGASMKASQKSTNMAYGGMARKK
jgi:hypothetical protein